MEIAVYKRTNEDWYGNYEIIDGDSLVEVCLYKTGPDPKNYKGEFLVCVWGNDDCGMELEFGADEAKALNIFLQVIGVENVSREHLISLGFVSA
jgi:hypothetical protein